MKLTRRGFIGGAAAFGAFGGCRAFRADSNYRAGDLPRLRFGVVSDIHIHGGNAEHFIKALEYFRDHGADAVMVGGDMSDAGLVCDLQAVADAWNRVFPGNRAPDGRTVEKLFVTGNHDWEGQEYGDGIHKRFPDPAEFARNVLRTDWAGNWERVFGEPYAPVWMKEVRGYKFVGAHWIGGDGVSTARSCMGKEERFNDFIGPFYAEHADEFDPDLPFFHVQHPHPKDTCYGSWAWGHDNGCATAALSAFPNAVAFSGHSHYSLTDERSVWQGAFTSIGASSLRYIGHPYDSCRPHGYENTSLDGANKVMAPLKDSDGKQGMLVSVYDDAIVLSRREFVTGLSLGKDWVIPLPVKAQRPFAFKAQLAKAVAPEFPANAAVRISKVRAKTRKTGKIESVEKDAWELKFPAAVPTDACRVHEYEARFVGADGKSEVRRLLAPGYHLPPADPKATAEVVCTVPADVVPSAPFTVEVRPLSCWLKAGRAIVAKTAG